MRRVPRRWMIGAVLAIGVLVALIPIGRWERHRHVQHELAGIRDVLAAIGPLDRARPDAYRMGVGFIIQMDCLLYGRGKNPFALEFCFDGKGRVVEAIDRRGNGPRISTVREDPSAADVTINRPKLERLIAWLESPRN